MLRLALCMLIAAASAFVPGHPHHLMVKPEHRRAISAEMMPKFLKDLFPDMDKPDNPMGAIKNFFGGGGDEEPKKEEEPAPKEDEPAKEE